MTDTSSIVSALGAGSGIDMTALATNLATAQFQQRTERLTAKSETLERQISAASSLKSSLSLLASALGDRVALGRPRGHPADRKRLGGHGFQPSRHERLGKLSVSKSWRLQRHRR